MKVFVISRPNFNQGVTLVRGISTTAFWRSLTTSSSMASSRGTSDLGTLFEDPQLQTYIRDVQKLIVDEALLKGTDRKTKVVNFQQPEQLKNILNLPIEKTGSNHEDLLALCKSVIDYSVRTGSSRFYNQLYSGINAYGLTGAWLTDALNTNIHTYEVAPAFIVIEMYLMEKLCSIVGYKTGDGIFCPGGSFCNIMAMNLARFRVCPEFKTSGMYGLQRMKLYTSAEAHYSMVKSAVFLGMGSDNVVKIQTDKHGRMIPEDLERQIEADKEKGEIPVFVMATAGTTVLGAYDPLESIADICEKHNIWLHCDACWGGGVLLSKMHRYRMKGIARTDSLSWNLHKMSAMPLQSSAFLIKQKSLMDECNRFQADYLFQTDKCYDTSYDIGDKTVQCGRKVDCLKVWLMWKALGDDGMEQIVDRAFDNARYFTEQIRKTDGFRLVIPEFECTNICFWYIPKSLRGQNETPEWWQQLAKVAPKIKERMQKEGTLLIGYQPLTVKGLVNFFRIIISNARCDHSDMDYAIKEIDRLGNDL